LKRILKLGAVFAAMLFISMAFVPAVSATLIVNAGKGESEIIGEPWGPDLNDLSRLGTDEILALAARNETVRKIVEHDRQTKPARIESLEDILPDPARMRRANGQFAAVTTSSVPVTVYVWIVADEEYRSYFGSNWKTVAYNTIESADNAFYRDHNINFVVGLYSEWDSDDNVHDYRLLHEAQAETGWNWNKRGMDMMAIFTNQPMDHRGYSELLGDAWIMKHQITSSWDWHLAQHESSHNYGCPDHGYFGPWCIMTYTYMMITDQWCSGCDQTIECNRYHF